MRFIGLDIGGTKIEGILWSGGRVLNVQKIKTPKNRGKFLKAVAEFIPDLKGGRRIQGLGISCAGAIEERTGKIIRSPNMPYLNGVNLPRILSKKFRVRAKIQNDTNCFLLGELKFGQARGRKNVVALTLGTGVGGAVLIDGRMLKGAHVSAAELGHMMIASRKSPLLQFLPTRGGGKVGGRGEGELFSVEDLCSSHFFKRFNLGGALDVQHKAEAGNKKAKKIYRQLGRNLGIALANLTNIFDPELIILGGGISRGAHLFLKDALAEMKKHVLVSLKNLPRTIAKPARVKIGKKTMVRGLLPPVKISKLKHAGALGAVSLFLK